ncbi:MAG: DNA gyrase inhibitor YacG [Rhizobiaceae bacterium]|nr:DNA gyrase inhibitor YacG [Rhizobiaceae bacterium]
MSGNAEKVTPLRARRPCPECGKPSSREHYPFCSARCKDVDLNRWLSGAYVIPGRPEEDDENAAPETSRSDD